MVLTFLSRRVFIDALGIELLGLNSTITNLLGLLNLSEMGIATAVAFTLYRPIAEDDRLSIREIVSVQGWIYSMVALVVLAGWLILMLFVPSIFASTDLPLGYAYAGLSVSVFSSLLGYIFNYRQILHAAHQRDYKNVFIVKSLFAVKLLAQVVALRYLELGYESWLILEAVFAVLTSIVLDWSIRRSYPWLRVSITEGYRLRNKYPIILIKVKQLFFHKLAGFILNQTSPLIVFALTSLSLVAIYDNYMMIITGASTLTGMVFASLMPIIGNMLVEEDKVKERQVFGEYMVLRMLIGASIAYGLLLSGTDFVRLWLGSEYVLPKFTFYLLVAVGYINLTRPYDIFLIPYGLVEDTWAPIVEAGLNIGLSLLLGYFFGLPGILCGILISLIVIVLGWKGYFLATKGLLVAPLSLIGRYFGYTLLFLIIAGGLLGVENFILDKPEVSTLIKWVAVTCARWVLFPLSATALLLAIDPYARLLINRLYRKAKHS